MPTKWKVCGGKNIDLAIEFLFMEHKASGQIHIDFEMKEVNIEIVSCRLNRIIAVNAMQKRAAMNFWFFSLSVYSKEADTMPFTTIGRCDAHLFDCVRAVNL